jgi:hypothetical protein
MDQTIPNCASKFLIKTEVNKVISPFVSICSGGPQRPKRPRPRDENRRDEVVHPEGGDGENQGRGADRGPARRRRERGRVAAGGRVAERAGHPTVGQFIIGEYSLTFQRNSYFEMYTLQDHPSSDSFYDSDFADGETTTTPQVDKQQDKDSEGSQQDQFENAAEVDGEWGRQRTRSYTLCLAWYRCAQLQANVCSCRFSRFLVRLAIHQHRDESRQKDTVLSLESLFLVRSYFGIMLLKAMGNYCTTTNNFKYDDSLPHSFCHKLLFSIFPSQFSPESRHFSHARARKTTHRTVDGRLGRSHSSRLGYRRTSRNDRDGHPTTRIHPFHPPAQMHSALLVHGKTPAISVKENRREQIPPFRRKIPTS